MKNLQDRIEKNILLSLMIQKVLLFLKVFFCSFVLFFISLKAASQSPATSSKNCQKVFKPADQTDLFVVAQELTQKNPSSHSPKKQYLVKADLLKQKKYLIQYFEASDKYSLVRILQQYPQLKNLRWTKQEHPQFFQRLRMGDYKWCPKGWGLLQLASYFKNSELLSALLELGVNVHAKKKQGGESLEDNALHISLRQNFKEGIDLILTHQKPERFGERKKRFIDEKSYDKKTPWFLAIRRDLKHKNTLFTNLIGQHNPSGHVQSFVMGKGARDGFEVAYSTKDQQFITLAFRYLQVSKKYKEYKRLKEVYGKSTKPPSQTHYHPSHRYFR